MISREKCLEWAKEYFDINDTDDLSEIEALINRAYQEGAKDMRERVVKELGVWIYTDGQCLEAIRNLEIE